MNTTPTITLNNQHGAFTIDSDLIGIVRARFGHMDDIAFRQMAARLNGYDELTAVDIYRGSERLEVEIMLIEGGNY